MSVVIILLIASLLVAGGFLAAFLWAVRNGQYDDLETPAARILFDDADVITDKKSTSFPKE
jgi:cbb3-type cytochrome oxidase maturation protein